MRFSPRIFLKPLFKADDLCVIYAEHRLFLLPRKGVFMDFLTSLAVICLSALLLGSICSKIKLPPLLGMLIIGIVLGPYVLDLISPSILGISADLRELALIIILTRAGLNLNLKDLKKNGISAVLLCFLPATAEILGYVLLGSLILRLPVLDSAILGSVMVEPQYSQVPKLLSADSAMSPPHILHLNAGTVYHLSLVIYIRHYVANVYIKYIYALLK